MGFEVRGPPYSRVLCIDLSTIYYRFIHIFDSFLTRTVFSDYPAGHPNQFDFPKHIRKRTKASKPENRLRTVFQDENDVGERVRRKPGGFQIKLKLEVKLGPIFLSPAE